MTIPALIPAAASESNRHKRPWGDHSRTLLVPLWTKEARGEEITGKAVVPVTYLKKDGAHYVVPDEHTNERHRFDGFMREQVARWVEWRRHRGWIHNTALGVDIQGPIKPPSSGSAKTDVFWARAKRVIGEGKQIREVIEFDEPDEVRWFWIKAYFKRETPVYVKESDFAFMKHLNDLYSQPEPEDSGWVNPLEHAEKRRQRLGLKRKDYLLGPLSQPL